MSIQFEYFYGSQAEQFSFYRIPKILFTDETLSGISVEAKVLYSDTTLYAHWSLTGTRTLTFAAEDGSYIEPVVKSLGTAISLAEFIPTRYGYDFDGWYSDPQTKENRVTAFTFNESDTVYAKWIPNGTAAYTAPAVQRIYASNDEILAFGNYIDEKTGVPVTAQLVEQNKRLNELMEIYNEKFCK